MPGYRARKTILVDEQPKNINSCFDMNLNSKQCHELQWMVYLGAIG